MESEMASSLDTETIRSLCSSGILQLHAYVYAVEFQFRRPATYQLAHLIPGLQLVDESNASSYGATLDENWNPTEHELFVMGLMKFGRGQCEKISRYFVWTKTTDEVHEYDEKFFRAFSFMNSYNDAYVPFSLASEVEMRRNENGTSASTLFSNPLMIPNETPKTLKLFPERASFTLPAKVRDVDHSTYQFLNGGTSMNVTNEVDLELHLG